MNENAMSETFILTNGANEQITVQIGMNMLIEDAIKDLPRTAGEKLGGEWTCTHIGPQKTDFSSKD